MNDYKTVAIAAAKQAGVLIAEYSKREITYSMKNPHDIQAEADLKTEALILDTIRTNFPTHSILSEEAGTQDQASEYCWIVDPIDGTINFARHIEEHCVSIALSQKGQIILGVIYQPSTDKLFVAERGMGAYLNGKKIRVATENTLINCLVATDNSSDIEARKRNLDIMSALSSEVRHTRIFGSSALLLARIAQGQIDFYYKTRFNYWDYAAGSLIVEEAGGIVTDMAGNPIHAQSQNIFVATKTIYNQAFKLVSVSR